MKTKLLEPMLTINHIDQNSIEKIQSIDETCVRFEPAISIEIIKLLSKTQPRAIQFHQNRADQVAAHLSSLDEHEQALAC